MSVIILIVICSLFLKNGIFVKIRFKNVKRRNSSATWAFDNDVISGTFGPRPGGASRGAMHPCELHRSGLLQLF